MAQINDPWQSGAAYEKFMGRWSTLAAQRFLSWLAISPGRGWLDVGCGTGSLTRLILEKYDPREVISIDPSPEFIAHAQHSITHPSVHFSVGRAESLDIDSGSMDAVVSGFVLNFVPRPEAALSEMLRVTQPGGLVGAVVWDYAAGMQMLRYFWDAAIALDSAARKFDEGARFPLCREGQLEVLFREAGFQQVEAAAVEVETVFRDFDDYWQPFLGNVGPAPGYAMRLSPADRQRLEDELRQSFPIGPDGSIALIARAWAVRGTA